MITMISHYNSDSTDRELLLVVLNVELEVFQLAPFTCTNYSESISVKADTYLIGYPINVFHLSNQVHFKSELEVLGFALDSCPVVTCQNR